MPETPLIRCPRCKTQQPRSGKCIECGLDFREYLASRKGATVSRSTAAAGPSQSESASPSTPKRPARNVRCPKCGTSQPLGNFCIECGMDFREYASRRRAGAATTAPPESAKLEGTARLTPETRAPQEGEKGGNAPADLDWLFSSTWKAYKERVLTLVALYIIAVLVFILPIVLFAGIGVALAAAMPDSALWSITGLVVIGTLVATYLFGAGFGALTAATMDDSLKVGPALRRGFSMSWAYIWVVSLAGYVVMGGFFLFLVPGFIFAVWFFFSQYLIYAEPGVRGMDAMLKSRQYVRGHGWDTFFKLFLIMILSMMAGMLPIIGQMFFMPFMMLYIRMMYEDLTRLKGTGIALPEGIWARYKWLLLATLGWIIPVLIAAAILIPLAAKLKDSGLPGEFQRQIERMPGQGNGSNGSGWLSSTSISTDKQSYAAMEGIVVSYSGMPGNNNDWITVVPANAPEDEFGEWYYTGGNASGEMRFLGLAPGDYEARAYHDWPSGGFDIKARAAFTVGGTGGGQAGPSRGKPELSLSKRVLAPSESFVVYYRIPGSIPGLKPSSPAPWAVIVQEIAPHDDGHYNKNAALEFQPIEPASEQGELVFQAPQLPGRYEIRIFSGGSGSASGKESEGVELASAGFAVSERKYPKSVSVHAEGDGPVEVTVYIYSLNYTGSVRLNGNEFYKIEGEPDMNYNSTQGAELMAGRNRFDVDYRAIPGNPWKTSLKLKVYVYDYSAGAEQVIAEWDISDEGGNETFEIIVEGLGIKT